MLQVNTPLKYKRFYLEFKMDGSLISIYKKQSRNSSADELRL